MSNSLNVIALISGGKDSFFSLIHCLQNGHKVIALGNLYPTPEAPDEEEKDLNSFMYQTVGHQVIPLYSEALGLPLYRQEIKGTAVVTGLTYAKKNGKQRGNLVDETESLIPLLKRIMKAHPEANALSTGAILSTYQRTRVESVALRLGLTPLSYLWQYPFLPGHSDITLLQHMSAINLDARIIKVASGGLDESFLWENVASPRCMARLEKAARRFGIGGGAVMGEGGEYETLVLDGPDEVFKGRIVVEDCDRLVVREGGGAAWLRIKHATVVMKDGPLKPFEVPHPSIVEPKILEPQFQRIYDGLKSDNYVQSIEGGTPQEASSQHNFKWSNSAIQKTLDRQNLFQGLNHCTFDFQTCFADESVSSLELTLEEETFGMMNSIRKYLEYAHLEPTDLVFAMIMLRSMEDFVAVNKIYGSLFPSPNPPARVTIACGDVLPGNGRVMINLTHFNPKSPLDRSGLRAFESGEPVEGVVEGEASLESGQDSRNRLKALHVQSRSYWAPANIGPYSQAISVEVHQGSETRYVYVAGQIPLIPASMNLPGYLSSARNHFSLEAVLALQHLWQIGREMEVNWWTGAIAFLGRDQIAAIKQKAIVAGRIWAQIHSQEDVDEDDEVERDLWEEKHHYDHQILGGTNNTSKQFPDTDRSMIRGEAEVQVNYFPPFFAAEVEELPRQSSIEWQAVLGLRGGGPFTPSSRLFPNLGMVNELQIPNEGHTVRHFIVAIPIEFSATSKETLQEWYQSLTEIPRPAPRLTYLDFTADVQELLKHDLIDGIVPCRSLWDSNGNRLAAVVLFMETGI